MWIQILEDCFAIMHVQLFMVYNLKDLHHEGDDEGTSRDGHPVHDDVLPAAVVCPVWKDVGVPLDFHQDRLCVGKVGLVLQGRWQAMTDSCVRL